MARVERKVTNTFLFSELAAPCGMDALYSVSQPNTAITRQSDTSLQAERSLLQRLLQGCEFKVHAHQVLPRGFLSVPGEVCSSSPSLPAWPSSWPPGTRTLVGFIFGGSRRARRAPISHSSQLQRVLGQPQHLLLCCQDGDARNTPCHPRAPLAPTRASRERQRA